MLTQKFFTIAQHGAEAVLWLLLLLSVLSVGVIIERFFSLRSIKAKSKKVQDRIRETLQTYNLDEVEDLSRDKDSIEGRALSYGLRHIKSNGSKGLEEIFNSYSLIERPRLEKSLSFLATVGNNAPFVGLLGTVLGIMKAFNDLSVSASADNKVVMAGIAEALVATAVGLLVAIPAVAAFNYFQKQVRATIQSLESVKELCAAYAKNQEGKS